jgi:hypothetical protein
LYLIPAPDALCSDSKLEDILWNFGHFRKGTEGYLTLAQTPHFYCDLPQRNPFDAATFKEKKITEKFNEVEIIHVLIHNSRQVFFEFAGKERRAFDCIWTMDKKLVLRGERRSPFFLALLTCLQTFAEFSNVKPASKNLLRCAALSSIMITIRRVKSKKLKTGRVYFAS